jgi:hypothetical protein
VKRLNIELQPGLVPGEAKVRAEVLEASPYSLAAQIANNQSPTVGEIRGQVQGSAANILGVGDVLAVQYGRSQGINDGAIAYSLPLDADDTRLSLCYDINGTAVVTPALSPLNVTSRYDSIAVGLSRPVYRTPEESFILGANLERRRAQTFLLGEPFSFTAGSDNGKTNVTALRPYQVARPRRRARFRGALDAQFRPAFARRYRDAGDADREILLAARAGAVLLDRKQRAVRQLQVRADDSLPVLIHPAHVHTHSAAACSRQPSRLRQRSTQSLVSFSWAPFWDSRRRRVGKSTRSSSWSWLKQEKTTVSVPVAGS